MNFIKALLTFIRIYRDGFFFSENVHKDPDGSRWGFYRFNYKTESGLYDIDFCFSKKDECYFHVHGNDFRLHYFKETQLINQKDKGESRPIRFNQIAFDYGYDSRKRFEKLNNNPYKKERESFNYYSWNMGWMAANSVYDESDKVDS
jgi:hypothetical protein